MIVRVRPESSQQLADTLRTVKDKDVLVMPHGTGSMGLSPRIDTKKLVLLELCRLDSFVELAEFDFYVKCQSGLRLADLYKRLKEKNLRFPFLTEKVDGTVGGMIASGQIRTERGCYNISRWVLAVTITLADGVEIETGAAIFKSVAGYDLPRFFCGSFGTLGVITEATLRCLPIESSLYGEDIEPVSHRVPILTEQLLQTQPPNGAEKTAQKIKHALDPEGIFPVITGWNKE